MATSSREGGLSAVLKTAVIFTIAALPVAIFLDKRRTEQQLQAERSAFRRLGLDWQSRIT